MTQQLVTTARHGLDWIFQPRHHANGISSFSDKKFYVVLFLYLAYIEGRLNALGAHIERVHYG